jgi:hypothetical protein
LYVGGEFTAAGSVPASHAAVWDGQSWTALGGGFSGGQWRSGQVDEAITVVKALTFSEHGTLYAAGNFTRAEATEAYFVAAWDGGRWRPLGSGVRNFANTLLWHDNRLFVGGEFVRAGNFASSKIGVWYEAPVLNWTLVGSELNKKFVIDWPDSFPNYLLESTPTLNSGVWTSNSVTLNGNRFVATNEVSHAAQFFRLRAK